MFILSLEYEIDTNFDKKRMRVFLLFVLLFLVTCCRNQQMRLPENPVILGIVDPVEWNGDTVEVLLGNYIQGEQN